MSTKRTVLVLHGYSQNASIFSKRLGALRRECGNSIEFVFIDAPHVLRPADLPGSSAASFGAAEATTTASDPTLTPRAWWKVNPDKTASYGLSESLAVVRDVLKTRRFDGVLGFSQGAAFAALLSSLLEKPHHYAPFLIDDQPPHPPFHFCVAVSGFRLRDPLCDPLFDNQYATPSLHVIGRTDIIVTEERSQSLVDVSTNGRVEYHDGGHFVPSKKQWLKFLRAYMLEPSADLPSPSVGGSSVLGSGTATSTELTGGSGDLLKL